MAIELTTRIGRGSKALLLLAAVSILLASLKAAASVVVPVVLAACVAAATQPIVNWLRRRKLPTFVAVTIAILLVLGALVAFGAMLYTAGSEFSESFPRYERAVVNGKYQLVAWLSVNGLGHIAAMVRAFDLSDAVQRLVAQAMLQLPGVLTVLGMVLLIVLFILLEAASFRGKLRQALDWRAQAFVDVAQTVREVQRYLLVKTAVAATTGILAGTWCAMWGLRSSALWGVLAFSLNYIPNIGSVVAAIPPVLVAAVSFGIGPAVGVAAGYFVLGMAIGNLIEPRILGHALGLSPLVVFMSMVFWGYILGPIGALLSVPLTMVVKIVLAHTEDLAWIAVLLGAGEGGEDRAYVDRQRESRVRGSLTPPSGEAPQSIPPSEPAESTRSSRQVPVS